MEPRQSYKDYYYTLGVSPEATTEEIREAYGELYEKYGPHVSVSGRDPETLIRTFKDISEAYECLTDPYRRQQYDQANLPHLQKTHLRALWGKFSGVDTTREPANKNEPTETKVEVEITLKEAFKGTRKSIRVDEQLPCQHCAGLKPVNRLQCQHCRGSGNLHNMREEEIEIPAGAFEKMELRKSGRGKYDARTQRNGDLSAEIKIKPHPFFDVLGRDIACTVPITIYEAVLGGEVDVPTATGRVIMRIQPLTQSGRVYRLKGLGLGGADLLVTMEVTVPLQINADEVVLFRKLKEVSSVPNPREAIFSKLSQSP